MSSNDYLSNSFNGKQKRKSRAPFSKVPSQVKIVAMFPGTCIHCEEPIKLGELIRRRGHKYAHDRCILVIRENVIPKVDHFRENLPAWRPQVERIEAWTDLSGRLHHARVKADGSREKID